MLVRITACIYKQKTSPSCWHVYNPIRIAQMKPHDANFTAGGWWRPDSDTRRTANPVSVKCNHPAQVPITLLYLNDIQLSTLTLPSLHTQISLDLNTLLTNIMRSGFFPKLVCITVSSSKKKKLFVRSQRDFALPSDVSRMTPWGAII